ncbi:class I SAM-dependent methyltransferase [Butyrivibrio fibrisolvens]|uniref:hypothetical protein n=1 Tax=Pseudobutyrivibrio ruminis TaxID=46206 RepID=UPI0004184B72|nr:hypothetical protein [Pseudobutyrivibrio ruminis]MDC7279107.1 class I SAM-dependent methyltransferase [Butyrivibrio fibrisolvens]
MGVMKLQDYFDTDANKEYLEIGPLYNPMLKKGEYNVRYLDFRTTEEVKATYEGSYADVSGIVDIDYATGSRSYKETVGNQRFDGVYSRHCIEHTYDVIGHLMDVASILKEVGRYVIEIPDGSCWFDYFRQPTTFREAYCVYKGASLNCFISESGLDTIPLFSGSDIEKFKRKDVSFIGELIGEEYRIKKSKEIMEGEDIFYPEDSPHIWVFTTRSFLELYRDCLRFNIFPYKMIFYSGPDSEGRDCTIKVVLEKCSRILEDDDYRLSEIIRTQLRIEEIGGETGGRIASAFKNNKEVYLYGKGKVSKILYDAFREFFDKNVGFVVSDDVEQDGDDVLKLSQLKPSENVFIIIATKTKEYVEQMEENLVINGFIRGEHYITI